ncbi:hypothetical protein, partial [Rhizobium leguminosarum]|uniref:hypothetical protein n=1 Tax=Rhizobium leguminosarum TaxID=384 RepID=UPI00195357AF
MIYTLPRRFSVAGRSAAANDAAKAAGVCIETPTQQAVAGDVGDRQPAMDVISQKLDDFESFSSVLKFTVQFYGDPQHS